MTTPPVCNYEGSDYQKSFWDEGGRAYEDLSEAIALRRLLPAGGKLMLELGAGAGRNTSRYSGFERIVVLDYSTTQLAQAQQRLGVSDKYIFVAADIYRLPFRAEIFDGATMIRTLHHMADAPKALAQIRNVMQSDSVFVLEFANKLNLKSILRYWLGKQDWSPFTLEPVEFVKLNFDFHPKAVKGWLIELGFSIEKTLAVSHFRLGILKRLFPAKFLAALDGIFQPTGELFQLTPSVFIKSRRDNPRGYPPRGESVAERAGASPAPTTVMDLFKCPDCGGEKMEDAKEHLRCVHCSAKWNIQNGIYDFREKA